jgi:predicted TIM-barrel fold metal-dependent hydrolase
MLPPDTRLFSVDDHVIEPPNLWMDRLPAKYREVGPRIVREDDGSDRWHYEDMVVGIERGSTRSLPEFADLTSMWASYEQMRPACYDPVARLADMDIDGVWTQVAFPNFPRFAGHRFLAGQDKELSLLCIQAYNDFVIDDWSGTNRDRLAALAVLPLWDPQLAAAEVRRAAGKGARAIAFSENPTVLGLPSIHTNHWDPVWEAISETGLPVCLHIGSSSRHYNTSDDAPTTVLLTCVGINAMMSCADWIFSGLLDRFPAIRIVLSEGGAGWVPYILERADTVFSHAFGERSGDDGRAKLAVKRGARLPSEIFAQHIYACTISEHFAAHVLEYLPVDNLLWETDYPHNDSLWPHSRKVFEEAMSDVDDTAARKIGELNARRLFGMDKTPTN